MRVEGNSARRPYMNLAYFTKLPSDKTESAP